MAYELWSTISGNQLAAFDTEAEALTFVRAAIETEGREYAAGLLLVYENSRGRTRTIAASDDLVQRAETTGTARTPRIASA
jgi:hypothetical protein